MLIAFLSIMGVVVALAAVVRDPGSGRALTSIVQNPSELPLWVKVLSVAIQSIISGFHWYGHWLQTTSVVCYTMDLVNAMKKLQAESFREGRYFQYAHQHLALNVLQENFSQLYSSYLLMIEVWVIYTSVLNLYLAVEWHSIRSLILATGVALGCCWAVREFAEVYETSEGMLNTWRRSEHVHGNIWFRKFLRSCKPARIPLGSLFYIDKGFILTVLSIIIDNSANLILAN